MPPKTVAVIGAVCLTTGWLLASILTPPVANVQALPERRPTPQPASVQEIEPFVEPLRLRRSEATIASTPRRNPFAFGNRTRREDSATRASLPVTPSAPIEPQAVPAPVGPIYALSGIGISETTQGIVRTAVLSDGTTVHLVKVGETVGGYTVLEITDTTATLTDSSGTRHSLRLRN
jgi:hypothetical protein